MLYFETSAVAKLLLHEEGSDRARELWELDMPLVSSWATYAETCAALASARRSRRLSRRAASEALRRLRSEWDAVEALDVDDELSHVAGQVAVRHGLQGMHAIHLASALTVAAASPVVVTWDAALRRAARSEGLAVSV
jgi:predicted nucleic acid-binding protein